MSVVRRAHRLFVRDRRVEVLAASIAPLIPHDATLLDVGCGDGAIAAAIMDIRPDVVVTGLDVLVRPETRIPVQEYDGDTIPFPDRSFDAVMFVDVLHHTNDPCVLLREAARVAPGAIIVKDHLVSGPLARTRLRVMDWFGNTSTGVALPYNYWRPAEWERAFEEMGLKVACCITRLDLYPPPAAWIFGGRLHVVWRLEHVRPELSKSG